MSDDSKKVIQAARKAAKEAAKPTKEEAKLLAKASSQALEAMEVTTATLKDPGTSLVMLDDINTEQRAEIARRAAEIDITSTQSIVKFGSRAQEDLVAVSDQMLEGVRNKDVGPAGDALRSMVVTIRGFEVDAFDDGQGGIWDWFMSLFAPAVDFQERFTEVKSQIDRITDELLGHETVLLRDIKSLDMLYEKSVEYYDELALYIAAGAMKLVELDGATIPAKEAEVAAAPEAEQIKLAQELRDLRQARDDLERRVHDLKLTRQVTMQSLPSIRLVQENDKGLVAKINSTIVNTVPLWRTQLAQAIAIQNAREAAGDLKAAADLTDELLKKNADTLRETNREVREQMERGVVDMEALKHSHAQLIATIEETLQIAEEGKAKRVAAEAEMIKMEAELRAKLVSSKASSKAAADASAAIEKGAKKKSAPRKKKK